MYENVRSKLMMHQFPNLYTRKLPPLPPKLTPSKVCQDLPKISGVYYIFQNTLWPLLLKDTKHGVWNSFQKNKFLKWIFHIQSFYPILCTVILLFFNFLSLLHIFENCFILTNFRKVDQNSNRSKQSGGGS